MLVGLSGLLAVLAASSAEVPPAPPAEVLARVGALAISSAEVEARALPALELLRFRLLQAQAAYERGAQEARASALRELLTAELLRAEASRLGLPLEEVRRRWPPGEALEALWKARPVEVVFAPLRQAVDHPAAPSQGPASAAVTLVEFGDYECPHCAAFEPTLRGVLERYGGRVRRVYRHFPLATPGQRAFEASEVALCAQEQGRFWEVHALLFREQRRLPVEGPLGLAAEAEVDLARLRSCLAEHRHAGRVREDQLAAAQAGVVGTPTVFVNGIYLPGNVSRERLMGLIEEELTRAAAPGAAGLEGGVPVP